MTPAVQRRLGPAVLLVLVVVGMTFLVTLHDTPPRDHVRRGVAGNPRTADPATPPSGGGGRRRAGYHVRGMRDGWA